MMTTKLPIDDTSRLLSSDLRKHNTIEMSKQCRVVKLIISNLEQARSQARELPSPNPRD